MSSEDPLARTAKGITVGLLEWSKEEITALVYKLSNKDLACVFNFSLRKSLDQK